MQEEGSEARIPAKLSQAIGQLRDRFSRLGRRAGVFRTTAHEWLLAVTSEFRRQVDRTGLFPDLKGESGRTLRRQVATDGEISKSYMLMCALSAGIAALGLLQSSTAVVIGAMLISPLMGPIAALGFAFASLDGRQIRDSARVIIVGAVIGILTGVLLTWLSPIRNATPEIIARTEPTLLDLAIAVFSGVAGAYATVWQRGATAIGVAIATALMPPLATVGYGLGVGNGTFAMGAFLLFLTNLAAIAFSFALVARMSGAARHLANVNLDARFVIAGIAAFAVLATPLAATLYRVRHEASAMSTARKVIIEELGVRRANITQLELKWPLGGDPAINVVVISPRFRGDAESAVADRLEKEFGTRPELVLQQIVAADLLSQTRAIVSAAVEQTAAGISRDVPPLSSIRAALGLPVQSLWVNRTERTVRLVPADAPGWKLADYRALEQRVAKSGDGWRVQVIPPVRSSLWLTVTVKDGVRSGGESLDAAIWAIERWDVPNVAIAGFSGRNIKPAETEAAIANAAFVLEVLGKRGIGGTTTILDARSPRLRQASAAAGDDGVEITVIPAPPARQADQAAPAG